jgi:hypothetical protein
MSFRWSDARRRTPSTCTGGLLHQYPVLDSQKYAKELRTGMSDTSYVGLGSSCIHHTSYIIHHTYIIHIQNVLVEQVY